MGAIKPTELIRGRSETIRIAGGIALEPYLKSRHRIKNDAGLSVSIFVKMWAEFYFPLAGEKIPAAFSIGGKGMPFILKTRKGDGKMF